MEPPFWGEGEVVGVSDGTIRKSDGIVSYKISIVSVAISVTIRPQFAIECLRRSNKRGGSIWTKISGCSPWARSMIFGSAESEHISLSNSEIIFEEF